MLGNRTRDSLRELGVRAGGSAGERESGCLLNTEVQPISTTSATTAFESNLVVLARNEDVPKDICY